MKSFTNSPQRLNAPPEKARRSGAMNEARDGGKSVPSQKHKKGRRANPSGLPPDVPASVLGDACYFSAI